MDEKHTNVKRIGERIVRAMIIVGVFHVFWKLGGFLVTWLLIHFFGSSPESDAYVYAIENIVLIVYFIVEESLGPSFMPVFILEMERNGEESAWEFGSTILNLLFLAIAGWIVVGMMMAPEIVGFLAPGFENRNDPLTINLTIHLLRYALPGLLGLSIGSLTYVIINAYKVFSFPAAGDAVQKFLTFAAMFVAFVVFGMGFDCLAVGFLAGAVGKIVTHLIWLRHKLIYYRLKIALRSPAMKRFAILLLPLLAGIVFAKVRDVVTDRFASHLAIGIPTDIRMGKKIGNLPVLIIPYALSIAIFPFLCDLSARRDSKGLGHIVTRGLNFVALFFVPLSVITIILRVPVVRFIFDRGGMTPDHVYYMSMSLAIYSSAFVFYASETVLMQSFFSMQNTWLPASIGMLSSGVTILILYVSIVILDMKGAASFFPVVIAFPVGKAFKNVVLAILMKRKVPILPWHTFSRFLARLAVVTVGTGVSAYVAWMVIQQAIPLPIVPEEVKMYFPFEVAKALRLAVPSIASLLAFVFLASLLKMGEFRMVADWLRTRIRGKSSNQH